MDTYRTTKAKEKPVEKTKEKPISKPKPIVKEKPKPSANIPKSDSKMSNTRLTNTRQINKSKLDFVEEELNQSGFDDRNENRTCGNLINYLFDDDDENRPRRNIDLRGSRSPQKKSPNKLSPNKKHNTNNGNLFYNDDISPERFSSNINKMNLDKMQSNTNTKKNLKVNKMKNIKDLINKDLEYKGLK